ncbi:succinylglutamate desuccinylase [Haliea sp. E17]|uniref:succinylglutamate desuccinylase/aspartoacylase family protein n=1 Tax=Haliea sp. E17 TaxID=3401576 RepID=UPI003AAAB6B3
MAAAPHRATSIKLDQPVVTAEPEPGADPEVVPADADSPSPAPARAPSVELDKPVIAEPSPETTPEPAAPVQAATEQAAPEEAGPETASPDPAAPEQPAPEQPAPATADPALATAAQAPDPQDPLTVVAVEEAPADTAEEPAPAEEPQATEDPALLILGTEVPRSTATRLSWSPSQSLDGIATPTPVLIVNGAEPGPVLCLTGAIHGDELNGIEIVRRALYNLDPESLSGTVIGVPIVNLQGFHRSSRYLADRRDLNRYFPGYPEGSSASRIAYSFFEEVIRHCDALVDLHTGSFHRTNMPQLRGDLRDPRVRELTEGFGNTVVLQSRGASGTLRRAAVNAGIPAVTLEAGGSMRLQQSAVNHGVNGITTLMNKLGMIKRFKLWGDPEPIYHRSLWVRAEQGGILLGHARLGDNVSEGDLLGSVTDPITNISTNIFAPRDARVIGMAVNQVVLPGYAAFHLAFATPKAEVEKMAEDPLQFIEPAGQRVGEAAVPVAETTPSEFPEPSLDEDPDAPQSTEEPMIAADLDDYDE